MRNIWGKRSVFLAFCGAFALAGAAAALFAAEKSPFNKNEKAFYLSEKEQSFIRPGLVFEIHSAWIEADGAVKYSFTVTDPRGVPLDLDGRLTPGVVTVRSVVARIPAGASLYDAYTTRTQTSPITGDSALQATADVGGRFERTGPGEYVYTFGVRLPPDRDPGVTHTVGAWARRDLQEFNLGIDFDADTLDWVPDGSPLAVQRRVAPDAACNQCHGVMQAHDNRSEVALCILCHNPGSADPDTGNTVDMTVMIHKIHMGADLPSVQAGQPYQIIGFGQSVHDYSTVHYPADVRNCQTCHIEDAQTIPARAESRGSRIAPARTRVSARAAATAAIGAENPNQSITANHHLLNPSRRACGSCHDDVNFQTGANHAGLPQLSDTQCGRCHAPQGELEFDLSIKGSHTIPRFSQELPGVVFEIHNVEGAGPGQRPTVTFSIADKQGQPVTPQQMSSLSLRLAGNTTDYTRFFSENARIAEGDAGRYFYTFQQLIPEDASGTWAVAIEGFRNAVILPGTLQERAVRDAGTNVVRYFSLGGGPAQPRRTVVTQQKCDSCHFALDFHGSNRNEMEMCVLCHNTATTDVARRPGDAGPPESVNFKDMIHRIHAGPNQTRDYTIYGFGGTPHNYNGVRYPNDLARCDSCHVDGSERLPLAAGVLPTGDPRGLIDPAPPATAACLSCHTSISAAAHADLNISSGFGESCDVCHGSGSQFSVERVHAR